MDGRVLNLYPHELSGGMKQRVCIAMAITLQPELIIADEPTSSLDVVVQRQVAKTLIDVQERLGASIIIIGHDMALLAQTTHRVANMNEGDLVELNDVREIYHQPRHGRQAWKFPVGLGWYARPVVEGSKVNAASPSMHTTCFCLDMDSGQEVWKSTQEHHIFGIYRYPAIASTPLVLEDCIVLRDVNSHWGNDSQAKYLHYIDKSQRRASGAEIRWACRLSYAICACRDQWLGHGVPLRRTRHLSRAGHLPEFQPPYLR